MGTPPEPQAAAGSWGSDAETKAELSPHPVLLQQETSGWGRLCPGSTCSSRAALGLILAPKSGSCLELAQLRMD